MASTETALDRDGLFGTLAVPQGQGPFPALVIVPGSGPVDRDGNFPGGHNDSLKLLAHALAETGIATLRFDKRAIGQSAAAAPREEDLTFDTYVSDLLAWIELVAARPEIAAITLLGHSEGALVATLAARRTPVAGLVALAGASQPAGDILARQLAEAGLPPALQARSAEIVKTLRAGHTVSDIPPELAALYRPSVQNYLISWLSLDPAAQLAALDIPTLIVQGTSDLQITPEDAKRLHAARPDATLVLIAGMNHILKPAPSDRAANLATYNDPALPLHPDLVPAIADFVLEE